MTSKKVISDIVSKYSLGNNVEKVKWVITDKELYIDFDNESHNLIGRIEYKKEIGLKPGNYGIFNTSQLIKCLNILDGDILMDISQKSKLNMADTNYEIKFNLADPKVIRDPRKMNKEAVESHCNVTFNINDEFITRFVKSKDALGDIETFTIETREGFHGEELVFTIGTNITNTIEFTVENPTIIKPFGPLPFDSNLFKEILKANRDYDSGKFSILHNPDDDNAVIITDFQCNDDLNTTYYLIRKL